MFQWSLVNMWAELGWASWLKKNVIGRAISGCRECPRSAHRVQWWQDSTVLHADKTKLWETQKLCWNHSVLTVETASFMIKCTCLCSQQLRGDPLYHGQKFAQQGNDIEHTNVQQRGKSWAVAVILSVQTCSKEIRLMLWHPAEGSTVIACMFE